ncbi:hypothetical protein BDW74DRAFT_178583 [Aspergillus multicolor]|uniref:uncharacterized protein n=1 Tax=Aspergillus multicolor TaxID=41759 RepID=UPI003CCE2696
MTTNASHILRDTMRKNLTHKERALDALGLLGVWVSIMPVSSMGWHDSHDLDRALAKPLELEALDGFQIASCINSHHNLVAQHFLVRMTVFDKRPLVTKIGRGLMVLLAVGAQVGLSFIAV